MHILRYFLCVLALIGVCSVQHASAASVVFLTGYPLLRQQHSLTCESSAASMGTRGIVTETQLMQAMPRNPNPHLGFRGNPNGFQRLPALSDYGVYAEPLQRALRHYGYDSTVIAYGRLQDLTAALGTSKPVVAWITYTLLPEKPRLASADGEQFILVPREHAVLLVGYTANNVIAQDPWTAKRVWYPWAKFLRSWGLFGNMALVIDPCLAPGQVTGVTAAVSSTAITWTWNTAPHADRYAVSVVRADSANRVVYRGVQQSNSLTMTAPSTGATYTISVSAVSPCGKSSAPAKLAVLVAGIPITSTPVPTATLAPTATSTPARESTMTPVPSPTIMPTISPTSGH